jgi:predicted AlkP superfamily phosphohydrolase/phosphomutase
VGARLLVLGIDAASPALIDELCAAGRLPNLRRLRERGLNGPVRSVDGFFVGSTWPSFQTGLSPAKHGLHYLAQLKPGTYEYHHKAEGDLIRGEPFWRQLRRSGLRTAVLDVPLSQLEPLADAAGAGRKGTGDLHVVEWGSHDAVYGFRAAPAGLGADILSRFGAHPLPSNCDAVVRTADGYAAFIDSLIRGVRTKAALTCHYLRSGHRDFFMQVFTEAHCAGHQCWHLHDASHPSHDPALAERLGDPLERVYTAIDEAVGEILEDAGDAMVFVLSAHGMAHAFGAQFLLHEMLFRLGVSAPPASARASGARASAIGAARQVWRRLPSSVRAGLSPLRERMRANAGGLPVLRVDPAKSLCFPVHNGLAVGGIRLNLIGREVQGRLEKADVDAFCDDLRGALLSIVDDQTGEPVVRRVMRTAELYGDGGECIDALPDLLVEWSDTRKLGTTALADDAGAMLRVRSPRTGLIEGRNDYGRTGEHRIGGMFIASGRRIQPGSLDEAVSVMDFAPTFSGLLGVEQPSCDGLRIPALADSSR